MPSTSEFTGVSPDAPTSSIAIHLPDAIPVFQRLWIDFSGPRPIPLRDAVDRVGANVDEVLAELLALPPVLHGREWGAAAIGELLDHIISTHHELTKNAMPALWDLLAEVIEKHGNDHPEIHDIAKIIAPLFTELGQHLQKEEQLLFPYLRRMEHDDDARRSAPEAALQMMEDEHDHAREAFHQLRELTNAFRPPARASESCRSLYAGLAELGRDLRLHIHLENNILHVRARDTCAC